jgi:hypothetical protein
MNQNNSESPFEISVEKTIDLLCEYRSKVREIALKAIEEKWSCEKTLFEINLVSKDIDEFISFYSNYKKVKLYLNHTDKMIENVLLQTKK